MNKIYLMRSTVSIFIFFMATLNSVKADSNFAISNLNAFSFFETSSEPLIVDGITSAYKLGAVGAEINVLLSKNINITGALGFGYAPNQSISYSDANFNGNIQSVYTKIGIVYHLTDLPKRTSVDLLIEAENREVKGDNLTGFRRGTALTGKVSSGLNTTNLMMKATQNLFGPHLTSSIGLGLSKWEFNGTGHAWTPTAMEIEKNANGNGIDPFAEVMLAIKGERYSYLFKLRRNKISADNTVYIDQLQFQISKSF
jgi:hypothetical protein